MDCSPPGSSVHGISQARILEPAAISFAEGSYWPRNQTLVACTGREILLPRSHLWNPSLNRNRSKNSIWKIFPPYFAILTNSFLSLCGICYAVWFVFWFFGLEVCGVLAPQWGVEPTAPALQHEILITGPSEKSLSNNLYTLSLLSSLEVRIWKFLC